MNKIFLCYSFEDFCFKEILNLKKMKERCTVIRVSCILFDFVVDLWRLLLLV